MAASLPSEDPTRSYSGTTLTNSTPAPPPTFLGLPSSIRRRIYEAILVSDQEIPLDAEEDFQHQASALYDPEARLWKWIGQIFPRTHNEEDRLGRVVIDPSLNVQFLRACKTVYEEGLPILYCNNIFAFTGRATTKFDLDRLISGRARDHLACVRLHINDQYMAQIFEPRGPDSDFETLWLGLCHETAGIRKIHLSFMPRDNDEKDGREMSAKFLKFMTHISLHMEHGCRIDLLPKVAAKVVVSKVGDYTSQVIPMEIPYQSEMGNWRSQHETLYTPTPVGATVELNASLPMGSIMRLARACEGRWTSPTLRQGLLDVEVCKLGSVVEMTLTKFNTTAPLYDGPPSILDRPDWDRASISTDSGFPGSNLLEDELWATTQLRIICGTLIRVHFLTDWWNGYSYQPPY